MKVLIPAVSSWTLEVPLRLAVCGGWANPKGTGSEN
jgi:hypothetical protein